MSFKDSIGQHPSGKGCYECYRAGRAHTHDHKTCRYWEQWRAKRQAEAGKLPISAARLRLVEAWEKGAKALKSELPRFDKEIAAVKAKAQDRRARGRATSSNLATAGGSQARH